MLTHPQDHLHNGLTAYYAAQPDTWDSGALHISDLVQCTRAVWYRRNGHREEPPSPARRITMQRGRAIEAEICAALCTQYSVDWQIFHDRSREGQFAVWLAIDDEHELVAHRHLPSAPLPPRAATGHLDFLALHDQTAELFEIKSIPFLGPAPLTKHVMQAAGYEAAIMAIFPTYDVRTHVIEVSAVTGEYRSHHLDRGAYMQEVTTRLFERTWTTAPGDELPEPSIPAEMFVERGRKPNKRLVNLLCEKYCGYTICPENHVGEAEALADRDD